MINTSRQIDTVLFYLQTDVQFNDTSILKGHNQIRRVDKMYYVYRLDDLNKHYTYIYLDEMPKLLKIIHAKLIDDGALQETETKEVKHTHLLNSATDIKANQFLNVAKNSQEDMSIQEKQNVKSSPKLKVV